jgi:NitT/TauT family transport system substrate-binding protein
MRTTESAVAPSSGRRRWLHHALRGASALAAVVLVPRRAGAQMAAPAVLAVPGPRNSVSLPLELAVALGHDRAAGLPLRLKFVGGGGVVIQDMRSGNAEFGSLGLPAMLRANLTGGPRLVALAAIDDLPLYALVVRADLRDRVTKVADLANRTLGVHSNSLLVRSTSHQLADYLLQRAGVDMASVKVLAAGQSWETQSAMLSSRTVDATMCDEIFATRLVAEGLAFKLFSTGNPEQTRGVPGTGFLRAVLVAPQARVDAAAERCERMVKLVQRTLAWMATNPPAAMADALAMQGAERDAFLAVAREYTRQYSRDGRFPSAQLAETATFFRASNGDLKEAASLRVADMVVDRWAGVRP